MNTERIIFIIITIALVATAGTFAYKYYKTNNEFADALTQANEPTDTIQ